MDGLLIFVEVRAGARDRAFVDGDEGIGVGLAAHGGVAGDGAPGVLVEASILSEHGQSPFVSCGLKITMSWTNPFKKPNWMPLDG